MRQKNAREQITRCIMMSRIVPASTSAERCQQSSSLLGGEEKTKSSIRPNRESADLC